jgi:RNA polymerase sigma factor (sigma-70 family)
MQEQKFSQNMVSAFNERKGFAVARFYDSYRQEVKLRVVRLTRGSSASEDLVQDIFIEMIKNEKKFVTVKNIENYLWLTIRSSCDGHHRKLNSNLKKMYVAQDYYEHMEEESLRNSELKISFQAAEYMAMELLSPKCKEVFILSYIRDMRNKEIAGKLGLSERTVDRHINIALNRLRHKISSNDGLKYFIKFLIPVLWLHLASL